MYVYFVSRQTWVDAEDGATPAKNACPRSPLFNLTPEPSNVEISTSPKKGTTKSFIFDPHPRKGILKSFPLLSLYLKRYLGENVSLNSTSQWTTHKEASWSTPTSLLVLTFPAMLPTPSPGQSSSRSSQLGVVLLWASHTVSFSVQDPAWAAVKHGRRFGSSSAASSTPSSRVSF